MSAGKPFAIIGGYDEKNDTYELHFHTSVGSFGVPDAAAEEIKEAISEEGEFNTLFDAYADTPIHFNAATSSALKESLRNGVRLYDKATASNQGEPRISEAFGRFFDCSVRIAKLDGDIHVRRCVNITGSLISYMFSQPDTGFTEVSFTFAEVRAGRLSISEDTRQFGSLVIASEKEKGSTFSTSTSRHVVPGVELADIVSKDLAAISTFMVERNIVGC